ncbi:MAG: PorT family protein [Bacteroidales bacterium]|nr:PorT family protein [Bacteroidales bacterium]
MKKIFAVLICLFALSAGAMAQITNLGLRGGIGISKLSDDLTEKTPILAVSAGGYATLEFTKLRSPMAYIFYLQGGLNVVRRGGGYSETFAIAEGLTTEHHGNYDAWYVQVPILANFRFELPVKKRNQYLRLFFGPAASYGIIGTYSERKVTPFQPQRDVNYKIHNAAAFDYMNRLDVEAIFGFGYENRNITFSIYVDHGFLSVYDEIDALRTIENGDNPVTHAGSSLTAYMVSVGYRFPLRKTDDRR